MFFRFLTCFVFWLKALKFRMEMGVCVWNFVWNTITNSEITNLNESFRDPSPNLTVSCVYIYIHTHILPTQQLVMFLISLVLLHTPLLGIQTTLMMLLFSCDVAYPPSRDTNCSFSCYVTYTTLVMLFIHHFIYIYIYMKVSIVLTPIISI